MILVFHHCGLSIISNMEFLYSWVTNLYICIAQLENTPIKSMLYKFVKIQPQEYNPGFGQFIADLVSERREGGSPLACVSTDRAQISDYLPPDWCFWYFWCQIEWYTDDDNGRTPAGGGWSPNLGLSAASEASDGNLGHQMTDTSQRTHLLLQEVFCSSITKWKHLTYSSDCTKSSGIQHIL